MGWSPPLVLPPPQLLLPLNNKLLIGRKIKHRTMSNEICSVLRICDPENCSLMEGGVWQSWQFVTCDDGPVTHHTPPACWQTIQSRTSNLTSGLTRVFMSRCSATLSLRLDTSDNSHNTDLAQCYTGINITTLTKHTVLCQMLKLYY